MLDLTLPDGSVRSVPPGTTALDVARSIGPGLAKAAVGAELDGRLVDLRTPIEASGRFRLFTAKNDEAGIFLRHTAEHVLADAVQRLWPGTQIDVGRRDHSEKYQYDFRFPRAFVPEDLEAIEEKMREILREKHEVERVEIDREEARELFAGMGEELKLERLDDIPEGEAITLFRHGEFVDLCRGPHAQRVDQVGAVKLLESSGVFHRGDQSREQLQRIYGTAFANREALDGYLADLELRRARDHRRLGPELDLFSFNQSAPGSPFFHPRGTVIYNLLVDYVQGLNRRDGFEEVRTPQILDVDLWHRSGHWDNYRENMFLTEVDERQYAVKPMNCPTHCLIYRTDLRSYRDLPIRYADFGRLHRYERSGVITGLTRVRTFCQDDAHTFCTEEQVEEEVLLPVSTILEIYRTFGFEDILIEVSTRPEKSIGSAELWERAENALMGALRSRGLEFEVNEGDGAFYGPKIDFQVLDALGRSWQLGTVQLDYQMPERLDLEYTASDGGTRRPVMLHRAMLGSVERFLGILIEHTGGAFPVWLAPVQAVVLPVSDRFMDYGREVTRRLSDAGVRVELDERSEKLGYKIRDAQTHKVPYMLVVGGREQEAGTVSLRLREAPADGGGPDQGAVTIDELAARVADRTASKSLSL
ncbi:MAG: threonine--tRNA ligase [Holophagales bacterium]|nr:threonine--tRNA ligase [Holophagales bacterium]MYC11503.1 threonine--tRNA ligase [Holophagales bacterium]